MVANAETIHTRTTHKTHRSQKRREAPAIAFQGVIIPRSIVDRNTEGSYDGQKLLGNRRPQGVLPRWPSAQQRHVPRWVRVNPIIRTARSSHIGRFGRWQEENMWLELSEEVIVFPHTCMHTRSHKLKRSCTNSHTHVHACTFTHTHTRAS